MKQLVITDKGIGMAEMPEKPRPSCAFEAIGIDWEKYESAKIQAISEALYFEDKERVKWLIRTLDEKTEYGLKHGTYPIPPDFPEVVEVRQWRRPWSDINDWADSDVDPLKNAHSLNDYRTVLRFVDEKKWVEPDDIDGPQWTPEKEESQEELWDDVDLLIMASNDSTRPTMLARSKFTIKRK